MEGKLQETLNMDQDLVPRGWTTLHAVSSTAPFGSARQTCGNHNHVMTASKRPIFLAVVILKLSVHMHTRTLSTFNSLKGSDRNFACVYFSVQTVLHVQQ